MVVELACSIPLIIFDKGLVGVCPDTRLLLVLFRRDVNQPIVE